MKLSIVSPVYKAEKIVHQLVERIVASVAPLNCEFEIVLVEDGSPDQSWEAIEKECAADTRVKGIKLTRNFGQHFAITAGLSYAKGDYVVVMDCDLQDDPKYIPEMLAKAQSGFDIVYTRKEYREFGFFKNFLTKNFNRVFNFLVENRNLKAFDSVGSFSLISKRVVEDFLRYKDYRRHYLMVLRWLAYPAAFIDIVHQKRFEGRSSYNMFKLLSHALDGIVYQSDRILKIIVTAGFIISFLAFLAGLGIIIRYFFKPFLNGWASLSVLILFVGGIIITTVGICGIYIGKMFEQVKGRPLFVVDKEVNL